MELSGVDVIALTKLDVLTGLDPLRVGLGYELDGKRLDGPPSTTHAWQRLRPIYEELPGWSEPLGSARTIAALPANARRYIDRLAALVGAPIVLVSVGPDRDQTIRSAA